MTNKACRSNIWKMYLFSFLTHLHFIGGILVPFFTDWGKISLGQVLLLQSWFMFWIFLFEIPTGAIADFFGRKRSLILASAINMAAVFIYASQANFYIFMVGEFLWAISFSLSSGTIEALVYDTLKETGESEKSKKIFSRLETIGLAGILIAAPLGSVMASHLGLRAPMLSMAIPGAFAFFTALSLKEPKPSNEEKQAGYFAILKEGMRFFYTHKALKILAFDSISIGTMVYFFIWLYQPLLKAAGVKVAYFGLVHAAFVASQIIVINNFETLEKLLGSKKKLIFLTAFLAGTMLILAGLASSLPLILGAIVVGGGFGLSRQPLFISYMNKYIPSPKRATVLSTVSMLRTLSLVVVNPLVGLLVNWSLNGTLVTLGLAALVFAFISKVEEKHLID